MHIVQSSSTQKIVCRQIRSVINACNYVSLQLHILIYREIGKQKGQLAALVMFSGLFLTAATANHLSQGGNRCLSVRAISLDLDLVTQAHIQTHH